jgi:glucose/arabinose dehydrogenase
MVSRFALRGVVAVACASLLAAVPASAQLRASVYVSGLSNPVAFVQDPSNPAIQYVMQQGGVIRVVQNGTLLATPFLNLSGPGIIVSGGEQGMLGLAFPPNYGSTGRFYVTFTNAAGNIVTARFLRSGANPLVANPASRFDLVWPNSQPAGQTLGQPYVPHPFTNHNGGNTAFGPDGYLYIGQGDGGSGNDPQHLAQNPASLLGKMLRIDVNVPLTDAKGYRIPADNPFLGRSGYLPEIWSFGLRNPWRWSFDDPTLGGTGALIIGDVGQVAREEIDYEPAGRGGRNYGWRNKEGTLDNVTDRPPAFLPLTDPIFDYGRTAGQCVTGGYVYRGSALGSTYRGRYFFADFCSGRVWSLALTLAAGTGEATASGLIDHTAELSTAVSLGNISSFGVDTAGELYLCSFNGTILRITRTPVGPNPLLHIDLPAQGASVRQPFVITGWALDTNATVGTGIGSLHVWSFPNPGSGMPPRFIGVTNLGNRPDVGAIFGAQFTPSGFGIVVSGLPPGVHRLQVYAWVNAIGNFGIVRPVDVTIVPTNQIALDFPAVNATVTQPFHLAGWSCDPSAPSGTGVDTIHMYAFPSAGGPPRFLGVPTLGGTRPDVAAYLGDAGCGRSGFNTLVSGLPPGSYDLVVFSHSTVTNTFDAVQVRRITVR